MATASIKRVVKGVESQLDAMIKRANLISGYLNRSVYPFFQKTQRERWMGQNVGGYFNGGQWKALDPKYAEWKKRAYKDSPGGGTKINIRTKRLFDSVVGENSSDHVKIVKEKSLHVYTLVPYAQFVDEARTFTNFSPLFYSEIYRGLRNYLAKNVVKQL